MQHRNRSSAHRIAMVATAAALALLGVAAGAGLPTPSAGAAVVAFTVTFDAGTHVAAGTSGTLTITAPTPYVGTVHVDSNGTASGLPTDVQFSGQTSKQVTGVALTSAGIQTITAQDTTISANNGSVDITVDPGPATHLAASIGAAPVGAGMHGVAVTALD
ncbi:MAG TPA: hypothetical protein VHN98_12930, partial [Acidimicrobiales bacterium]|nr:hypothetical protein [Acidimicrobiales bacterium]